ILARDAAVGAQLTQRESEIPHGVRGDRERLAHHGDATGPTRGRQRVTVGQFGVGVDEAGRHHEVLGDTLRVLRAEGLQLVAGDTVELLVGDVLGDGRVVVTRTHRLEAERVAVLARLPLPRRIVAARALAVARPQAL